MKRITPIIVCLLVSLLLLSGCKSTTRPDRGNGLVGAMSRTSGNTAAKGAHLSRSGVSASTTEGVNTGFEVAEDLSTAIGGGALYYRTSPGDRLAISFFRKPPSSVPDRYLINVGDRLSITVVDQPDLSKEVVVGPDGRFSYFEIGEIFAKGYTVPKLEELINEKFGVVIPSAKVTVMLEEGNVLVNQFLDTLTSNEMQGSSRPLKIRPDGYVNFPLIGEVNMVGKTLPALSRQLEIMYNKVFIGSLSVNLNMMSDTEGNVILMGEVRRPGRYRINGPTRVAEIMAMSGGPNMLANKTAVLVKKVGYNKYEQHYIRLDTDSGDLSEGFLQGALMTVNPGDVIIVPKSTIGKLDLWVHKYIHRLFLFRGTHISLNRRIGD